MAAHRYWRLMHIQCAYGAFAQLCEFYLRQTHAGADEVPVASAASSAYNGSTGPEKSYDADDGTIWMQFFGDENPNCWVAYDYGAPIDPVEMYLKASTGDIYSRTALSFDLQYSDTALTGPWTDWKSTGFAAWTADGETQVVALDIPATFERVTKAAMMTVAIGSPSFRVTKAAIMTVYNTVTPEIDATKAAIQSVVTTQPEMRVSKATIMSVVKGRVAKPNILMWTYTLDDHDYLLIQTYLETLVYDLATEQWFSWGSGEDGNWRGQLGRNWNANLGGFALGLGGQNMSNVLVGDDEKGALYFLDPQRIDDDSETGVHGRTFTRVVTGQLAVRGIDYVSCPGVELTGSNGEGGITSNLTVNLSYSDDRGHNFIDAGDLTVVQDVYNVTLAWRSLGSFTGPGRLFRFTDRGAVYRIDGMDIPDGK